MSSLSFYLELNLAQFLLMSQGLKAGGASQTRDVDPDGNFKLGSTSFFMTFH